MAKQEHVTKKYTTGKGQLVGYISLQTPSTKFDKDGVYSTSILLSKEEGEKLAEEIKAVRTEQFKKFGKGTKVAELTQCTEYTTVDEETGEETPDEEGRYILKAKAGAYIKDGKPTFKPQLFDSKGNKISISNIGAGTVAKVAVELSGYSVAGKTGVSVKLKAVQIIDLVEFGGGSAESYGFGEEEGFEGTEEVEETKAVETSEDDEDEDF